MSTAPLPSRDVVTTRLRAAFTDAGVEFDVNHPSTVYSPSGRIAAVLVPLFYDDAPDFVGSDGTCGTRSRERRGLAGWGWDTAAASSQSTALRAALDAVRSRGCLLGL